MSTAIYGSIAQFAGQGRPEFNARANQGELTYAESIPPGAVDPHERIKVMDADGIDIAFLYPSLGISWEQECDDPKLTAAYCRAYNNWLFDFCAPYPDRLKPIAHISLLDIDEAVKEARRVAKLGAMGTFLFAHPKWIHHALRPPQNDPYWAELQDLNLPVGIHVNLGPQYPGDYMYPNAQGTEVDPYIHYLFGLDVQIAFTNFIFEGVFERFANLRFLILESGAGWLPHWLDRLDHVNAVVYPNRFTERSLKSERVLPTPMLDLDGSRRHHRPLDRQSAGSGQDLVGVGLSTRRRLSGSRQGVEGQHQDPLRRGPAQDSRGQRDHCLRHAVLIYALTAPTQ